MKRSRRQRELLSLAAGLLIGLLLGSVMVGTSDSLRESLFGTAADSGGSSVQDTTSGVEFFLADMDSTLAWLIAQSPDNSEAFESAMDTLVVLPKSPVFREDFLAASDELDTVLPALYDYLNSPEFATEKKLLDTNNLNACLGMDDDPYSPAPTLYFYLTIPKEQITTLDLPSQWLKLDTAKSNSLFWQLLACYPLPDSPTS